MSHLPLIRAVHTKKHKEEALKWNEKLCLWTDTYILRKKPEIKESVVVIQPESIADSVIIAPDGTTPTRIADAVIIAPDVTTPTQLGYQPHRAIPPLTIRGGCLQSQRAAKNYQAQSLFLRTPRKEGTLLCASTSIANVQSEDSCQGASTPQVGQLEFTSGEPIDGIEDRDEAAQVITMAFDRDSLNEPTFAVDRFTSVV